MFAGSLQSPLLKRVLGIGFRVKQLNGLPGAAAMSAGLLPESRSSVTAALVQLEEAATGSRSPDLPKPLNYKEYTLVQNSEPL